jgi:ubiquinone/menaquinone biosynthesis C-methylase UbiE
MKVPRVPLVEEPINGAATVCNYDRYAFRFMRSEYRLTVNKIRRYGITSGRVLDIGTGSGRLALELTKVKSNGFSVVGLDISAQMLNQARNNTKSGTARKVNFVQATAARLPFPDDSFDIVTSYASLHHWQQPTIVFNEIWRVAKEGGLILIRDNRRMIGNPFFKTCISILTLFMNKQQRKMWPKSILASYTIEEVHQILRKSLMKNYLVQPDMGGFDLCIAVKKTRKLNPGMVP